jgi:hypothetical protein
MAVVDHELSIVAGRDAARGEGFEHNSAVRRRPDDVGRAPARIRDRGDDPSAAGRRPDLDQPAELTFECLDRRVVAVD